MTAYRTIAVALGLIFTIPHPSAACGFIQTATPPTFSADAAENKVVVFGRFEAPQGTTEKGSTKFVITAVLKDHPILAGKKNVTIPRYLSVDPKASYLCFAGVIEGQLDPTRATAATEAAVDYLKGVLRIDRTDRVKVLRYSADYLEHKDRAIAKDAFTEFMQTPDKDIGEVARHLSAKAVRGWVQDKNISSERLRLYGFLLGNCGGDEDARVLGEVLDRVTKQEYPGSIDGILTGYTLLKREEGWQYVKKLMTDANSSKGAFQNRFGCLRAARFFHNTRPDVVSEKEILAVLRLGLDQPDFADLPIEDLRHWGCWTLTDRILSLYGKETFDHPIVERSILRYALQCPEAKAAEFIAARRKDDPDAVRDVEETLQYEKASTEKK